jgi:hypothetical protein
MIVRLRRDIILNLFKNAAFKYIRGTSNYLSVDVRERDWKGSKQMDPITTAIVAALSAGAASGLNEASKTAIVDIYSQLKDLLAKKFGAKSEIVQAMYQLEAKPESPSRKETLQEEIAAVQAEQDEELLAAAKHLMTLVQSQQTGLGKFTIQNNAPVQGQNVGDHNTINQQFGVPPRA